MAKGDFGVDEVIRGALASGAEVDACAILTETTQPGDKERTLAATSKRYALIRWNTQDGDPPSEWECIQDMWRSRRRAVGDD